MNENDKLDNSEKLVFLESAIELAKEVLSEIENPKKSVFHTFCWSYLKKQLNHAISVKKLKENYDSLLIVRTMIESLCLLYWVAQDRELRATLWSDYRHVYNFKLLLQKKYLGFSVETSEGEIVESASIYMRKYISEKKQQDLTSATLSKHPFMFPSWSREKIFKVMDDVQAKDLYIKNYFYCSEWAHSSVSLLEEAMQDTDNIVNPELTSKHTEALCLIMAFQGLFETLRMANTEFETSLSVKINSLYKDFTDWFKQSSELG